LHTSQNAPKANKTYTQYLANPNINIMFLEPVESFQVIDDTYTLKPKCSRGYDDISTKWLKGTITLIHQLITHIVNQCFQTGVLPTQLKIANLIPIFKHYDNRFVKIFINYFNFILF